MSEWQPIETAPHDGRNILAFLPRREMVVLCWWQGDWIESFMMEARPGQDPTHWQPLPEPPNG